MIEEESAPRIAAVDTALGRWITQRTALAKLWLDNDYRRDAFRLLLINLRGVMGVRFSGSLVLLVAAGVWVLQRGLESAAAGHEFLQVLIGLAAIAGGMGIYAEDQQDGTFELLWLATGSERGLLRMKMVTLMIVLTVLILPAVFFTSAFLGGIYPVGKAMLYLLTDAFFILSIMALVGTFVPQAWAGGLVGGILIGAMFGQFHGSVSAFVPFRNPFLAAPGPGDAVNRVLILLVSFTLLSSAAKRLRRTF